MGVLLALLLATSPMSGIGEPQPPEAAVPVIAKLEGIASRASVIEAIAGMGEVDRAMRISMLEATRDLAPEIRAKVQTQAGLIIDEQDRAHTERLKGIIATHGWPKISETSERTAATAVLIANHSGDIDFQRQVLALLEPLAKAREARPEDYARLYDRIAMTDRRPQRYGTQGTTCQGGKYAVPSDLEAPEGLEARRAAMGLQPMAEYLAALDKMYGACVPPPR
ncbi:DUF6624 domain-containing protein [Caulobacter segnis]|uniref:DUF6624 domain-containing protein n=1 Tax=Caulobacter segnis TaxID=88688 RepID=UPI00285D0290|nr:DUF6624 domain-containing protein [Caulobacter segnis]MDR6627574.1 hypothetical protein [Caulobacter segnis]